MVRKLEMAKGASKSSDFPAPKKYISGMDWINTRVVTV